MMVIIMLIIIAVLIIKICFDDQTAEYGGGDDYDNYQYGFDYVGVHNCC